jgi:hypothetical protein
MLKRTLLALVLAASFGGALIACNTPATSAPTVGTPSFAAPSTPASSESAPSEAPSALPSAS